MIDEKVINFAQEFSTFWTDVLRQFPRYRLDFSWPSVGIVDLILNPLRGQESFSEAQQAQLRGAAAYLSGLAHDCWKHFPENLEINITYRERPPEEILLTAKGGRQLDEQESFAVPVLSSLAKILSRPQNPFPYFADGTRILTPESNLSTLFATGLFSGLCPYGSGPWTNTSVEAFATYLDGACHHLAKGAANFYQQIFPGESHGGKAGLYHPFLILPPAGYHEGYPGAQAVAGLIDYFRAAKTSDEDIQKTALNLAGSPDELISIAGFAISVALSDSLPSERLKALSSSRRISCPMLRPSVMMARSLLGRKDTWYTHIQEKSFDQAKQMVIVEQQTQLLPLLYLDDLNHLKDPNLDDFFHFISWGKVKEAVDCLEILAFIQPLPPELSLQQAYIHLILGDDKKAEEILSTLDNQALPSSSNDQFKLLELKGLMAEQAGKPDQTAQLYEDALALPGVTTFRFSSIGSWLSRYYFNTEQYERALTVLDVILKRDPSVIPSQVVRLYVLRLLGRHERIEELLPRVIALGGYDAQLFSFLSSYLLGQRD